MQASRVLVTLSTLVAVLSLIAAAAGLLNQGGGSPFQFTTVGGGTVTIWGQGLYRHDTPIAAVGFMAADAVTIILAIPLLVLSTLLCRRGSLKGRLVLSGTLSYFFYNYASLAFGASYNNLFIIYVAIFSLSLFALVLTLTSFELTTLVTHFSKRLPTRAIGIYLIITGVILHLVWLALTIVPALMSQQTPPEVGAGATFVTGVLDEGIVGPALIVSGILLLRRLPVGYLLATTMLIFTDVLGANLLAGGLAQLATGVMGIGPFIGGTLPFVILTLIALWFTIPLLRDFNDSSVAAVALESAARA